MRPQGLREGWVHQVPDLDALVPHLDDHLLPALVGVGRLGELDGGGGGGVTVADGDEVGEAAGGVGEEGEEVLRGGGRGEGRGGLEGGNAWLLGGW